MIAEVLGNGGRHEGSPDAEQGRLVTRRRHDDAAGQAFGPEIALKELIHFATALADQPDDVNVGRRVLGHHAERDALADAGAGEDPHPLALSAGEQTVDHANAGRQRCVDPRTIDRIRRLAIQRRSFGQRRLRTTVDHTTAGIDDAAQQTVADADPIFCAAQTDFVSLTNTGQIVEREQQRQIVAKADHFRFERRAGMAFDRNDRADRSGKTRRGDRHADGPHHAPFEARGENVVELFRRIEHR